MRLSLVTSTVAAVAALGLSAGPSLAETEYLRLRCQAANPAQTVLDCTAERVVRRDLSDRTHSSIFPTGNLVRAGDVQFQVHELGLYNRAAVGVSDHLELSVGAPIVPVVISAGARVSLTDRESPFRIVVGAGAWIPINDDSDEREIGLQVTATVAYQTERVNLHATASTIRGMDSEEVAISAMSLGLAYKFTPKAAWIADAFRLRIPGLFCSSSCAGDYVDAAVIGVKLMGEHFDTDVGLMFLLEDTGSGPFAIPVISTTYRY